MSSVEYMSERRVAFLKMSVDAAGTQSESATTMSTVVTYCVIETLQYAGAPVCCMVRPDSLCRVKYTAVRKIEDQPGGLIHMLATS